MQHYRRAAAAVMKPAKPSESGIEVIEIFNKSMSIKSMSMLMLMWDYNFARRNLAWEISFSLVPELWT